jgi:predicted transcriptional regulator YdeE
MNIQQHAGFYIAGLTARTNNAHEMSGKGKIGNVWQEFLQPNLVAKIPNKIGIDLIAVYTDYETDHTGHYTYLLGLPILSAESLPASLTVKQIPAGRYAVFSSNRGPKAKVVPELWQRIWSMSPAELGGTRAFKTDYEIYDQRAADPGERPDRCLYRSSLIASPYPASTDSTPRIDQQKTERKGRKVKRKDRHETFRALSETLASSAFVFRN